MPRSVISPVAGVMLAVLLAGCSLFQSSDGQPSGAAAPTRSAGTAPGPTFTTTPAVAPAPADTPTGAPAATSTDTLTPEPTAAPAATLADTAYERLLGTIPDTLELRREVYINDYALVRQMFDIPLPGPGDDEDALAAFYERPPPTGFEGEADGPPVREFGAISFFGPFNQYRNIAAENLQHLAFDVRSMDQSIVAFALPATLDVVRGRFDPQATGKALESCSECEPPSREEYGGVSYYSWGEDYAFNPQLRFAPPAFDEIGRGGRIAVLDEYVFRTLGTSDMKALIDAGLNESASLADVEEFRLLAGGMSRLGAYTMLLSDDVEVWDADSYAARRGVPGCVPTMRLPPAQASMRTGTIWPLCWSMPTTPLRKRTWDCCAGSSRRRARCSTTSHGQTTSTLGDRKSTPRDVCCGPSSEAGSPTISVIG